MWVYEPLLGKGRHPVHLFRKVSAPFQIGNHLPWMDPRCLWCFWALKFTEAGKNVERGTPQTRDSAVTILIMKDSGQVTLKSCWPCPVCQMCLNSQKGGKESSNRDSFFHTRKKVLKEGVGSHFPTTLKISQHTDVVASHPGMDYGQRNVLRNLLGSICIDFDLRFYGGPY